MANIVKSFIRLFDIRSKPILPDDDGLFPTTTIYNTSPKFNDYSGDVLKLNAIFSSPALLKVFCLQCDLFSLGKPYVYDKDRKLIPDDPFIGLINNPNPMQSQSQFLWDFMFWNMIGTAYCYVDSDIITNPYNKLYFLQNNKIEWPANFYKDKDKLVFSKSALNNINSTPITYRYEDGTMIQFPLSKVTIITDLTNGTGNWYKGNSRIDALYKIVSNSEAALDATNINTRYSSKFMVSGQQDPKDVTKLPMGEDEKRDIESKINGRKSVYAVKSMIEIKRFVEDMRRLELDKSYLSSYFLIGSMYGIPRDVLEAYNSSTYENQEKARASHVSYTLQPKGNDLFQALGQRFGYNQEGKTIEIDWSHLPFMQVFEKDKAVTNQILIQTFSNLLNQGVSLDEANAFLKTNFKTGERINKTKATVT